MIRDALGMVDASAPRDALEAAWCEAAADAGQTAEETEAAGRRGWPDQVRP
jgi:hypothetical protein